MRDDDPFDSPFFRKQRERREERRKENAGLFRRIFGWGVLAVLVSIVIQLLLVGAVVAVILWVALTILQHFGVLMIFGVGLL